MTKYKEEEEEVQEDLSHENSESSEHDNDDDDSRLDNQDSEGESETEANSGNESDEREQVVRKQAKRGRGRPRKYPSIEDRPSYKPPSAKKKRIDPTQVVDLDAEVEEDEIDSQGEEKIDINGQLSGDRQYILRSTILPRHPDRVYMLTTDVSKVFGFRDSYIYFQKNPQEPRYYATDEDKDLLAERGWIPSQFRSRSVLLLPARHVFRKYGYKVILRGVPIRDDYFVGDRKEGDPIPQDEVFDNDRVYDFKTSGQPAPRSQPQRQKWTPLTAEQRREMMLKSCVSAREFNENLQVARTLPFVEIHTNIELLSTARQPVFISVEKAVKTEGDQADWYPVTATKEATLYPISIMPGQNQCLVGLFSERFSSMDAQESNRLLRQRKAERIAREEANAPVDSEADEEDFSEIEQE